MAITTPVMPQKDTSFSSEGWFLYWKASFGLWEAKLSSQRAQGPLFVPIYWGLHSEDGVSADFGHFRPETQILKILDFMKGYPQRPVFFLFPLSPIPFAANGGIPPLMARHHSISPWGLSWVIRGGEDQVNHLYSFFDPRVYKAYRSFAFSFSQYLKKYPYPDQIKIIGMDCGCLREGEFISYFEDRGVAFEQGLRKFIEVKKEGEPKIPEMTGMMARDSESSWQGEYRQMIRGLYAQSCREAFGEFYLGSKRVSFLGGTPQELPLLMDDFSDSQGRYLPMVKSSLQIGNMPSSLLLPNDFDRGVLDRAVQTQVSQAFCLENLGVEIAEEYSHSTLLPLDLVDLLGPENDRDQLRALGLTEYLLNAVGPCVRYLDEVQLNAVLQSLEKFSEDKLFIHFGKDLHLLFSLFVSGQKVIFMNGKLDGAAQRKLEAFQLENQIHEQITMVQNIKVRAWSLGEGQLFQFSEIELLALGEKERQKFWDSLVKVLLTPSIKVYGPGEVQYFWQKRGVGSSELKFHEMRRFSAYNPTSYKKEMEVVLPKNFALTKIIDPLNTKVNNLGQKLVLEMHPLSSVSIEFGKFE